MKKYTFNSKIGRITLVSKNQEITDVILNSAEIFETEPDEIFLETENLIKAYLVGEQVNFNIPFQLKLSEFQTKVLLAIRNIPYGKTWSYQQLAQSIGHDKAYRACGSACKNNPLPLIIPCHRVIKKCGDVGEYRYGNTLKRYLIEQEKSL